MPQEYEERSKRRPRRTNNRRGPKWLRTNGRYAHGSLGNGEENDNDERFCRAHERGYEEVGSFDLLSDCSSYHDVRAPAVLAARIKRSMH